MNTEHDPSAEEMEKAEDYVISYIMEAIEGGKTASPRDVAIMISKDRGPKEAPHDYWRKYLLAVKQQAKHLARQGRISILRRGEPIDPEKMKGLVKFSKPVEGVSFPAREKSED
ncbi:DUF3253 domain-containing protein [Emcibacter sp.]|uniref:DUF3253 domain-containing protein n=1 Tax=Emcibacter sp. TaxID=1979954 RepID=UPI002AA8B6BC|nr:DUF3253 domain-containing protein [Emcibacter sp.]